MKSQLDFIETKLSEHGAILFRGFDVEAAAFERFAQIICPDLFPENSEHIPVSANNLRSGAGLFCA